ncbi:MAG: hypothetical protein J6P72_11040 [Firmicutes bacterium]|nr:hypothetical protein [Bacillota bacterium]
MKTSMKRILAILLSLAIVIGVGIPQGLVAEAAETTVTLTLKDKDDETADLSAASVKVFDAENAEVPNISTEGGYSFTVDTEKAYTYSVSCEGYVTIENKPPNTSSEAFEILMTKAKKSIAYTINTSVFENAIKEKFGANALEGITYGLSINGGTLTTLTDDDKSGTAEEGTTIGVVFTGGTFVSGVATYAIELSDINNSVVFPAAAADGLTFSIPESAKAGVASIDPSTLEIVSGETATLTINVENAEGWKEKTFTFASNKTEVASVSSTDNVATITAGKADTAIITGKVTINGVSIEFKPEVKVSRKTGSYTLGISFSPEEAEAYSGKEVSADIIISTDNPDLYGKTVTVSVKGEAEHGEPKTDTKDLIFDSTGKATYTYKTNKRVDVSVTATVAAFETDTTSYSAVTQTASYNLKKGTQTKPVLSLSLDEESNPITTWIYGDASGATGHENEVLIAQASSETTIDVSGEPDGFKLYSLVLKSDDYKDLISIDADGKVWLKPQYVGEIEFAVVQNGGNNYNNSDPSDYIKVTVNPFQLTDDMVSYVVDSKVYNGKGDDLVVTATIKDTAFKYAEDNGKVELVVSKASADPNCVAAGNPVTIDSMTLSGDNSKYYAIDSLSKLDREDLKVIINPATLTISVGNAQVEWTDADNKTKAIQTWKNVIWDPSEMTVTGFIEGQSEESLVGAGYKRPTLTVVEDDYSSSLSTHTITVNTDGNPSQNYVFDYANVTNGTLKILDESIPDADIKNYLTIDNDASKNVFQTADFKDVFYSEDAPNAQFTIQNTSYTKIWVNGVDVTEDKKGVDLSTTVDGQDVKFVLSDEYGTHKTAEFTIHFTKDSEAPEITIQFDSKDSIVKSFVDTITFNMFNNAGGEKREKELTANIKVEDLAGESKTGISDIKSWSYVVINTDKDTEFGSKEITQANVNEKFSSITWNAVPDGKKEVSEYIGRTVTTDADGKEIESFTNGNYIVFVLATDKVNNTRLYSSQGLVIENIQITQILPVYSGSTPRTVGGVDYFKDSVNLDVTVTEILTASSPVLLL